METITLKKQILIVLGLLLAGSIFLNVLASALTTSAQAPPTTPLRVIRTYDNEELGLSSPGGLAYSAGSSAFYVLEAERLTQPLSADTDVVKIAPYAERQGAVRLASAVQDPVNVVFDNYYNRLLILKADTGVLLEVREGSGDALNPGSLVRHNVRQLDVQDPQGLTIDPANGRLYILDAAEPRIIEVVPDGDGRFTNPAITIIDLQTTGLVNPRGIAFNPATGSLFTLHPSEQKLYELTTAGQVVTTRDIDGIILSARQSMVFAPTSDVTDNPANLSLFIINADDQNSPALNDTAPAETLATPSESNRASGTIYETSLLAPMAPVPGIPIDPVTLVKLTHTSLYSPPSPDPAGIAYISTSNTLLISDSEVNEMPQYFTGDNLFEINLSGNLVRTLTTINFSDEPTGVAHNPANNFLYFSDDTGDRGVYELNPGADGLYNTSDDVITFYNLGSSTDPEGVAYGQGRLYISDGANAEMYIINLGTNGVLNQSDSVTQFDIGSLGIADPEGVEYDPDNGHLYILSSRDDLIAETTTNGTLIRYLDIASLNSIKAAGLAYAPASANPAARHLYIVDRAIDNGPDPDENDGVLYEVSYTRLNSGPTNTPGPTSTPSNTPTPTNTLPPTVTPLGGGPNLRTGVLTNVGSNWTTVTLDHSYNSMVVVASPNYGGSQIPAVVRIRNASSNSFDIRVQNPSNNPLSGYTVHYMVVDEGVYTAAQHGVKMEALKFTSSITDNSISWNAQSRSYNNSYASPVVLGQVMTANDAEWSVFWSRGLTRRDPPDSNNLFIGKHVGEDPNTTRANETIGYIVVEAGNGAMNGIGYMAALGGDTVRGMDNSPPFSYSISGLSSPTVGILSQAIMDGTDGSWPLLFGSNPLTTTTLWLAVDEDQVVDTERNHTDERVAYLIFNAGQVAPTATPIPPTATSTPTGTPVPPTATNTPTNTPVPPTATNTPTNTPVPPTATNTSTNTPIPPTATSTPTGTLISPTATSTPTNTPLPPTATSTPTGTLISPTATSTPTNTPLPPTATNTPTNTPVPPTATSTPTATPDEAGDTFTFTAVADAAVVSNRGNVNFGGSTTLAADGQPIINSYLRFDVQNLTGNPSSATLHLWANSSNSTGIEAAGVADNSWGETTITYNNAPPAGAVLGNSGPIASGSWVEVDVTSFVTANGLVSFMISTSDNGRINFDSREAANAPQLIIVTGGGPSPTATNTATPGASATPTETAVPTNTPTPGPSATPDPGTGQNYKIYLTMVTSGVIGGITYSNEDVLVYDPTTDTWDIYFDGSNVGITANNLNAFYRMPDGSLLLSFTLTQNFGSLSNVTNADIMRFIPTSLGSTTAGTFEMFLDGSDVGLQASGENINAIGLTLDGRLLISTVGTYNASGITGSGHNLLVLNDGVFGDNTSGIWALYFNGADVGLTESTENINSVSIAANGDIYLTTSGAFTVPGASGTSADIFVCTPGSLGSNTSCTFSLYWSGSGNGLGSQAIDGLFVGD